MIRGGLYWEGSREDEGRAQIRGQKVVRRKERTGSPEMQEDKTGENRSGE